VLGADAGDDRSLTADDLGVILWIHSDGQLEAPESLNTQTQRQVNSSEAGAINRDITFVSS